MTVRLSLLVAVLGVVGCAFAAWLNAPLLAHAWLGASLTFGLISIGAIAALLTWHLTGGGWGEIGAPTWRALAAGLPVFALALALLLIFGRGALFPWTAPAETLPEVVRHKLLYLNMPFFVARSLFYFVVWLGLAFVVGAWRPRRPSAGAAAGGLVALLYTLSFFGFDWMLSLEPTFYTDVFGLWLAVTVPAAATAVVLLRSPAVDDPVSVGQRADLANLFFALLLGWSFMAFAQYVLIWEGNIPDEIEWYLNRGEGAWSVIAWLVTLLFFALPSCALLFPGFKRSGLWLRRLAALVLVGYVLQVQWWVLPSTEAAQIQLIWMSPLCLITLGAATLALCAYAHRRLDARNER